MPIVDLTHPVSTGMPVYPGTEGPGITQACTLEHDGFAEKLIRIYSHTGTHMDAPSHLVEGGPNLDSFPIETFQGQGICADVSHLGKGKIEVAHLAPLTQHLSQADYLLLNTGWGQYWGTTTYFDQHPVLSLAAAQWLLRFDLKAIGLDNISADRFDTKAFPVHNTLLERNILIIENMAHLDRLPSSGFQIICLPLKLSGADGAPVRAVAQF